MRPSWRIYYKDGSTFSDKDGTPFEAPGLGAEVIVQENANVARGHSSDFANIHGKDYFCWDDAWYCCDLVGVIIYLMKRKGYQKIVLGEMCVRDEDFWEIMKRASKEGLG